MEVNRDLYVKTGESYRVLREYNEQLKDFASSIEKSLANINREVISMGSSWTGDSYDQIKEAIYNKSLLLTKNNKEIFSLSSKLDAYAERLEQIISNMKRDLGL